MGFRKSRLLRMASYTLFGAGVIAILLVAILIWFVDIRFIAKWSRLFVLGPVALSGVAHFAAVYLEARENPAESGPQAVGNVFTDVLIVIPAFVLLCLGVGGACAGIWGVTLRKSLLFGLLAAAATVAILVVDQGLRWFATR